MLYKSLLASAIAPLVLGMDYAVMVGEGGNVFNPSTISGPMMGDTVTFMFEGTSHSVVESSFDQPCEPMSGGFSVGVQSKMINFTVDIMDSGTHWFYCSVPGHCNSGMVGVINPPSGETQMDFANKAANAAVGSPSSNSAVGGMLGSGSSVSGTMMSTGTGTMKATGTATGMMTSSMMMGGAAATGVPAAALAIVAGAVMAAI